MALVPNGVMRKQVGQGLLRNSLFSFAQAQQQNNRQKPKPDPRLQIEQQDIGASEPVEENPQQAKPDQQIEIEQPEQPQPNQVAPQDTEDQSQAMETAEQEKQKMRSVFFSIIGKHFGVNPEEELRNKALKNKEFGGGGAQVQRDINKRLRTLFDVDIQNPLSPTPILKGFFVVPNEIKGKSLDYKETVQAATEFCKRYGLDAKSVKEDDGGWRYEFITHQVQQTNDVQTGTSYDAVLGQQGQNKGAFNESKSLFKVSSVHLTLGEILSARKEDLFNTMRKISKGSK